jgi:hypothetical protein
MQQNVKVSTEGVEIEKRKVVVKSDVQQRSELYHSSEEKLVAVFPWFTVSWDEGVAKKVVMDGTKVRLDRRKRQ